MRNRSMLLASFVVASALVGMRGSAGADPPPPTPVLRPSSQSPYSDIASAVAIDGGTGLVSVVADTNSGLDPGAVYVFPTEGPYSHTGISESATIRASDAVAGDYFGYAIGISGNTFVATSTRSHNGARGAAWVFVSSGGAWTQQAKLAASDAGPGDQFGSSVAISGDTIVVGGDGGWRVPRVHVYRRSGTTWSEQILFPSDRGTPGDGYSPSAGFGSAVAIDGDRIAVGAGSATVEHVASGAAYVFDRVGNVWTQTAKLLASDPGFQHGLGASVAVERDTVVAGTPLGDHSPAGAPHHDYPSGEAHVFVRAGGSWSQQAILGPSDPSNYKGFGHSIAMSGGTVVVGTSYDNAYAFTASGGVWLQYAKLTPISPPPPPTRFWEQTYPTVGYKQAIAVSGGVAVVGPYAENINYPEFAATQGFSLSNRVVAYVFGVPYTPASAPRRGDVDDNGAIDMGDFYSLLHVVGSYDARFDLDGDGSVTVADAVALLKTVDGGVALGQVAQADAQVQIVLSSSTYDRRTGVTTLTGTITNVGTTTLAAPLILSLELMSTPTLVINEDASSTGAAPLFITSQSLAANASVAFQIRLWGNARVSASAHAYVPSP